MVYLTLTHLYSWEEKLPMSKSALESTWLYHEIGRCYLEMADNAKAKDYGEKSLAAAEEAKDDVWQLNACVLIAQSEGQAMVNGHLLKLMCIHVMWIPQGPFLFLLMFTSNELAYPVLTLSCGIIHSHMQFHKFPMLWEILSPAEYSETKHMPGGERGTWDCWKFYPAIIGNVIIILWV